MSDPQVYVGKPDALQAEIGLLPCYDGHYVVAAFDANGNAFEPESFDTVKGAKEGAADIAAYLGETTQVIWVD